MTPPTAPHPTRPDPSVAAPAQRRAWVEVPPARGHRPSGPPVGSAALGRPPAGEPIRAVLAVLLGRGDRAEPFDQLADRLALDGYAMSVVPDGGTRVAAVIEHRIPGVPFVLLGSDTGALAALAMAGSPAVRPDGLVLAGLPLLHLPVAGLPVEEPAPRMLPDLPILLLHGAEDEVSPLPLVRMTTRTAPRADLAVLPGGHDVVAGPGRRCVAARTLLFLESLVAG